MWKSAKSLSYDDDQHVRGCGKQSEFYIEKRVKENELKGQYHEMGAQ